MTHTQKRKIVVDDTVFEWCIRCDALYSEYATIYKPNVNGAAIYLDTLPWAVEIRPKTISEVISFAMESGWEPSAKGQPIKIGVFNNAYIFLPEGIKNSLEYESTLNK